MERATRKTRLACPLSNRSALLKSPAPYTQGGGSGKSGGEGQGKQKENGESKEVSNGGEARVPVFTRMSPFRPLVWPPRGYTHSTARLLPSSTG